MLKLWNNLPNAKLINQVLDDLRANPEVFAATRSAANDAAWDAAWYATRAATRVEAWGEAWNATGSAAWNATGSADRHAARVAAWDAISAFIAYDDSSKYLEMTYEELRVWAVLSEDPAAVLLLPYVWAQEQIKELT